MAAILSKGRDELTDIAMLCGVISINIAVTAVNKLWYKSNVFGSVGLRQLWEWDDKRGISPDE